MSGEINAPFETIAAVVQFVQIIGQSGCSIGRRGGQQFDGQLGLTQSSGGVQSRGEHEADVFALQTRFLGELRQMQQPLHPQTGSAAKTRQTMMDQNPIFIDERHDIGHGADRRQSDGFQKKFTHRRADFFRIARPLAQGPSQFERHARAAESRERIRRSRQSRMHNRRGGGEPIAPFMMIRDDELEAQLASRFRRPDAGDSAIDGDDQLRPALGERAQCIVVQTVSFVDPMGNVLAAALAASNVETFVEKLPCR